MAKKADGNGSGSVVMSDAVLEVTYVYMYKAYMSTSNLIDRAIAKGNSVISANYKLQLLQDCLESLWAVKGERQNVPMKLPPYYEPEVDEQGEIPKPE